MMNTNTAVLLLSIGLAIGMTPLGAAGVSVDEDAQVADGCSEEEPVCHGTCPNDPRYNAVYVFGHPLFCHDMHEPVPIGDVVNVEEFPVALDTTAGCSDEDPVCEGPCPSDPYKEALYIFGDPYVCYTPH